jgi:hypothetical protein
LFGLLFSVLGQQLNGLESPMYSGPLYCRHVYSPSTLATEKVTNFRKLQLQQFHRNIGTKNTGGEKVAP